MSRTGTSVVAGVIEAQRALLAAALLARADADVGAVGLFGAADRADSRAEHGHVVASVASFAVEAVARDHRLGGVTLEGHLVQRESLVGGVDLALEIFGIAGGRGAKSLTVDASDTAEGFFLKRGYVGKQRNTVTVNGEWLANTTMQKTLGANAAPGAP